MTSSSIRGLTRRAIAVSLGSLFVLLAACADNGESDGAKASVKEIPELIVATNLAPVESLDVTRAIASGTVSFIAYAPLEHARSDGSFVPGLARSVEVTPQSLVYDLEPDARFSDGTPITASDVVFTLERAKAAPQTAGLLGSYVKAAATGPRQVTVTLSGSDPTARGVIALVSGTVQEAFVTEHPDDFGSRDALGPGSGPYRAVSLAPNEIRFVRNDHYWGAQPKAREIIYKFIPDANTAQLSMRSGDVDAAILLDAMNVRQYQSIDGAQLHDYPSATRSFLSFDTSTAPFDDVHVRRAIAYAVDKENLVERAFGGYADPLRTLLQAREVSAVSDDSTATELLDSLPTYAFDLDKAKQELAMSKYPDGFSVTVPTSPVIAFGETTLLTIQENLKELDIDLNIETMPSDQWLEQLYAHEDLGMQIASLTPSVTDPSGTLSLLIGTAMAGPNGFNLANYSTPSIEAALKSLQSSTDPSVRFESVKAILESTTGDVPYVPLVAQRHVLLTGPGFTYEAPKPEVSDLINGLWVNGIRSTE